MAPLRWTLAACGQQSPCAHREALRQLARKLFTGPPDSNYNPKSVAEKGRVWKKGSFSGSLKRNWVKLKITYIFLRFQSASQQKMSEARQSLATVPGTSAVGSVTYSQNVKP